MFQDFGRTVMLRLRKERKRSRKQKQDKMDICLHGRSIALVG